MTSLTVYDGLDGDEINSIQKHFSYGGRYYDRYERTDYGYKTVADTDMVGNQAYRVSTRTFGNHDYYHFGLLLSEETKAIGNDLSITKLYTYKDALLDSGDFVSDGACWCEGYTWPALAQETVTHNENGQSIITCERYQYGSYGNVVKVFDDGDIAISGDEYLAQLTYATSSSPYIVSNVSEFQIGNLRHRKASYTAEGSLSWIVIDNGDDSTAYDYQYDTYGNVQRVTGPAASLEDPNDLFWIKYTYDPVTHSLPVKTENAYGYSSSAHYSYRWQKPVKVVDIGGATMHYQYDAHGNLSQLIAPLDHDYTIRQEYWYATQHGIPASPWVRTRHFDSANPTDDIITLTFSDAHGRIVQTKQDASVEGQPMRIVSGRIVYDSLGRKVQEYHPTVEDTTQPDSVLNAEYSPYVTSYLYDAFDRIVQTDYADTTHTEQSYSIAADMQGKSRFRTILTDRNSNSSSYYSDPRRLQVQVTDALGGITY